MMLFPDLGPHADFIVAAYAISILVIAALIGWIAFDYRAQRRSLDALEARGITRRPERPAERTA